MTKTMIALCLSVSLVTTPTLAHADPVGPNAAAATITQTDYSLDNSGGLLPKGGERLLAYGDQDSMPAPAPKKHKTARTALYVVGGLALLAGILYLIADNTTKIPDGFLEF